MDVHPPHEPIRSWRDFLLHLATITIGLLIAVALEAGVEELHYRHIVSAARANLRREISENHAIYAQNLQSLEANQERLAHNIEQLRDIRAGKPPQHIDMHWRFDWNSFGDSAWQSARDIGAISHMRPDTIETYSDIYNQQRYVNDMGAGILADEAKAAAPWLITKDRADPRELSAGDVQAMLLASAELSARLITLEPLLKTLDDDYAALLAKQ